MGKTLWKFFGVILAIVAVGAVFIWFQRGDSSFSRISRGEEIELSDGSKSVRVDSARIVSAREYTLSAPYAAKVDALLADEGDSIGASGSGILKLDTAELELELKKYESELARERAIVEKLQQGARYEELMVTQQKKKSAESSKKSAAESARQVLYDAFVQSDDAVRNQTDPIFTDPEGDDPQLSFSLADTELEADIEKDRKALSSSLHDWKDLARGLESSDNLEKQFDKTQSNLRSIRKYLDEVALAVNGLSVGAITKDTLDDWKAAILVARVNVGTAAVSVSEARSAYASAKQGILVADRELDLQISGSDKQDIAAALDAAGSAKSQEDIISERLKQATISTPEDNVLVKKIFPKKGEFVGVGSPIAIVSSPGMEIEADIPEEDIRGVENGAEILFRLAAFPEGDIRGKILMIKNQEIEKEGGIYFQVRASIDTSGLGSEVYLRPGMTGDMIVATRNQGSILSVPKRFLSYRNGRGVIKVASPDTGAVQERVVETGMDQGQNIEIISGLSIGDRIVE